MKSKYIHKLNNEADTSASEMVPILFTLFQPKSVVDVGCGVGHWLMECSQNGISELLGIDGLHLTTSLFMPDKQNLLQTDLEKPFQLNRTFDLVICLEVAEHLAENTADTFIRSLVQLGDTIIFSAAIPGQGGQNHINEQWPSYWQQKFEANGFGFYDIIRPRIWWNPKINAYYRQNMFIASRQIIPFDYSLPVLDVVHPDLLIQKADKYATGALGLHKTLKKWKHHKGIL